MPVHRCIVDARPGAVDAVSSQVAYSLQMPILRSDVGIARVALILPRSNRLLLRLQTSSQADTQHLHMPVMCIVASAPLRGSCARQQLVSSAERGVMGMF